MPRFLRHALWLLLACAPSAFAAQDLGRLEPSHDGTTGTKYRAGNKPLPGGADCPPTGWTDGVKTTGAGEICDDSGTWSFAVLGTSAANGHKYVYQNAASGDIQAVLQIADDYAGATANYSGIGVGISDGTGDSDAIAFAWSPLSGTTFARALCGVPGSTTATSGAAGQSRPIWLAVTYDESQTDARLWESQNGSSWSQIAQCLRTFTTPIVYIGGQSGVSDATLSASATDVDLRTGGSAITIYSPGTAPPEDAPTLVSPIPAQSATLSVAFQFDVSAYFSDPDPITYSATGLTSTGLSMSTAGLLSGTPNATAVSSSPLNVVVSATDNDGTTQASFAITVSNVPGDTFNISAGSGDVTFNCATQSGCGPGDTIVLAGGTHSSRQITFRNLIGTETSPITIRNDTAAGSRTRIVSTGTKRAGIWCINCDHVVIDGLGGWSGQAGRCGVVDNPNGVQDGTETAVDEHTDGCGIFIDGTSGAAQDGILFQELRRNITVQGVEIAGDWSGPGDSSYNEAHGVNTNDQDWCRNQNTDPDTGSELWVENFTFRKMYMRNLHDTAMYLGPNLNIVCNGSTNNLHRQRNFIIERNIVDTNGEGGGKVKSFPGTDPLTAIIRYNRFRNGGGSDEGSADGHTNRMWDCFEASCTAYGNILDTTVVDTPNGPGMTCSMTHRPSSWGNQVCHFYNNVISNTQGHGINAVRSSSAGASHAQVELQAEYNTIVDPALTSGDCINVGSTVTGSGFISNNICAGADTGISGGTNVTKTNNRQGTEVSQAFVSSSNFRLTSSSPARNQANGTCPSADVDGNARPQQGACDQGADEYAP